MQPRFENDSWLYNPKLYERAGCVLQADGIGFEAEDTIGDLIAGKSGNLMIEVVVAKPPPNNSMDARQKQRLYYRVVRFPHVARIRFLPTSSQPFDISRNKRRRNFMRIENAT